MNRLELLALLILFGGVAVVGNLDYADALVIDAMMKEARVERVLHVEAQEPLLTHPLPCDATMRLSVAGTMVHEGCYVRKP